MGDCSLNDQEAATAWRDATWRDVDAWRFADKMARNAMKPLTRKASLLARSCLSD